MDKMFSLMRFVVRETLKYMAESAWDEELLARYNAIMKRYIFDLNPTTRRNGITLHVVDVFLPELKTVVPQYPGEMSSGVLLALLQPFLDFASQVEDIMFVNRMEQDLVEVLEAQWTEYLARTTSDSPQAAAVHHVADRLCQKLFHHASAKFVLLTPPFPRSHLMQ
jgi:hypothetical protein